MAQNTTQQALIFLLRETIGDIFLFPIWWYTTGLTMIAKKLVTEWVEVEEMLSLRILLRNMFRPMFADYSKTGRLISFGLRMVLVVWNGFLLALWTAVELLIIIAWIFVPVMAIGFLLRQLIPELNG